MAEQEARRIAIFGQYKSGTTAIYSCIKNEMPEDTIGVFEKHSLKPAEKSKARVLAKVILDSGAAQADVFFPDFHDFDKRIYIVRDLRDWIVSGTLFSLLQTKGIYGNPVALDHFLGLIRRKQENPASVATLDILEFVQKHHGRSVPEMIGWLGHQLNWMQAFETHAPDCFTLHYEDFVENRLRDLSNHLGLLLKPDVRVASKFSYVERTRSSGNWRHWFTPKDVDAFRPVFAPYLRRHGYGDDWDLAPQPRIAAADSTEYVVRLLDRVNR